MPRSLYFDKVSQQINALSNPTMNESCIGVFVGTNETATEKTKNYLNNQNKIDGCHFGFSGWHNFDIIVERQSSRAVFCDYNPKTKLFLEESLTALDNSQNRIQFAKSMFRYVHKNLYHFSPNVGGTIAVFADDEVKDELNREGSWLSTDSGFSYVKELANKGKISIITEDIRNSSVFEKIAGILSRHQIPIDTLYLSNIGEYMITNEDKIKFVNTVRYLLTYETKLVQSKMQSNATLAQTTLNGADFAYEKIGPEKLFDENVESLVPIFRKMSLSV
jgi:hypothetical protein